jgi:DnaK suppressor protein
MKKKSAARKKPTAKKPTAKKPTAKRPAAKRPAAKRPAAKRPAARKPIRKNFPTEISKSLLTRKSGKKAEEERIAALRKVLIAKRQGILKAAKEEISKYIKGETRQLVDTALDDGDLSFVDLSEDISLKQLSTHRETLQKTDEAIRKLNEGTYGICEDCGDEISEERLKVMPFAIYCIDCQERREKIEQMERMERIR